VRGWADFPELAELCDRLQREAGAHSLVVLSSEGEILGHAGPLGALSERVVESIADLAAAVLRAADAGDLAEDAQRLDQVESLHLCTTPLGRKAALVAVFEQSPNLELVRLRLKRLRDLILRRLEAP
jgi:predicted regulator of Ras-like GTPase activity (Roadblock/LC7/MglB family)